VGEGLALEALALEVELALEAELALEVVSVPSLGIDLSQYSFFPNRGCRDRHGHQQGNPHK